jgi:hypothetical protein
MNLRLKDEELRFYSGEHLLHELSMFWELADILSDCEQGTTEYVALIESFAAHLRNLIEFFFLPEKSDYVRAVHFFENPAEWPTGKLTGDFQKLHDRASNEVNHLTLRRIDGNPPEKEWGTDEIVIQMEPIATKFGANADVKKLHPKVREFLNKPSGDKLLWLGDNVSHSNVASKVLTATTQAALITVRGTTASTATVLKYPQMISPIGIVNKTDD